ncbi:uncharacterized protein LOC109713618 isoform X2 [Ananas comosus]|uniref:Uncharacterized protein LOC109713618 isoform X2 n=1 Tax=Ananas comosus TaxID=4615 RepID=A0A6P5FCM2_ANACO|nr:uncharacterized protein LOC109713618 isoform X2 [Ananas comosus]
MGVMSRKVLPACGNLCIFCPSLRARSRQPVKRYKKLLADIFPKSQDGEPNERMISKLCEYASKNPMRIPKITEYLEQRCYKELRNEHFSVAKVVPCIYRKLLSSCKEQMPLLAMSSLCIVRTLLDQTREDEMCILGCLLLVDFLNSQVDSTYMFNVESLIPKICQLGQEVGRDEKGLCLRSAALQALASMVQFMGDYSHISVDFDNIVSVILDNYEPYQVVLENGTHDMGYTEIQNYSMKEVVRIDGRDSTMVGSKNPSYWSRICLQNMAKIAKEATTVRRVLEPLCRYFDSGNCWSLDGGIACSVLSEIQVLMEKSGQNSHLLLSIMIKHLNHKNVSKHPIMQINILKVATHLACNSKLQASAAIITAISDSMRHLRKCMQCSIEASNLEGDINKSNSALHSALEECLVQLTKKVGDVGPVLDMMAVMLENISPNAIVARATISSIYRTAQIAISVPNLSYSKKAFPEALLHQLLLAMAHPDHKTRVGSHRILSAILMPASVSPWSIANFPIGLKDYNTRETLVVALTAFSSSASLKEKLRQNSFMHSESLKLNERPDAAVEAVEENGCPHKNGDLQNTNCQSHDSHHNAESCGFMRLSSHQVGLLLSSIWTQALSEDNTPENYEAMAHSYNLALLFSRAKNSSHVALVRCFQLAFSLRSMSLDRDNLLQPSRKRSLYTLASSMLIFSAKASDLPQIVSSIKATMTENMLDPHLNLIDDSRLHATSVESSGNKIVYGSEEDELAASSFLATLVNDDKQLKEFVISLLMEKYEKLPEEKLNGIKEQLLQEFSPDDAFPLGAPMFMDTPHPSIPSQKESRLFDEDMFPALIEDEDPFIEGTGSQSDQKISESINSLDVLSVNQLIESVLESARQVANLPVSAHPVPYDQMKSQCEALVMGKQQKMSVLLSFKHRQGSSKDSTEDASIDALNPNEALCHSEADSKSVGKDRIRRCDSLSSESEQSFRLPPSSPYDKFLKAAGW